MKHAWLLTLACIPSLHADLLYSTDFENFLAGDNNWAGTDAWLSNDTTTGAQAIEAGLFPNVALGNSATLGFAQPSGTFVSVYRFFNYEHASTGLGGIEVNFLAAIRDSTNFRRDNFFVSFYNAAGDYLASVRFDNTDADLVTSRFDIWREDGSLQFDTLIDHGHGELLDLYIQIDLEANTWSADNGGFPLFVDEPFTAAASGTGVNFGVLAFEWSLSALAAFGFGDNFIAIDELSVRSFPIGVDPFTATGTRDPATGHVTLSWPGEFGFDYQVEFSSDLDNWHDTLPNSFFPGVTTDAPLTYTDTTNTGTAAYYRVVRSESP